MTTKFKKLYDKYKVMLIVATMLGACIYGYVFINKIGNPDKYFFGEYVIGGGWELSLGRFFLPIT
jgi:lipoprotein